MEKLEDPKGMATESKEPVGNIRESLQRLKTEVLLPKIVTTADVLSKKGYSYGMGKGQYVCDTFVKRVFADSGSSTLKDIYGASNMYKQLQPKEKFTFWSNQSQIPEGTLLFLVPKTTCSHVAIFAGMNKAGYPEIYDATAKRGVSKRRLWPEEGKVYYKTIV